MPLERRLLGLELEVHLWFFFFLERERGKGKERKGKSDRMERSNALFALSRAPSSSLSFPALPSSIASGKREGSGETQEHADAQPSRTREVASETERRKRVKSKRRVHFFDADPRFHLFFLSCFLYTGFFSLEGKFRVVVVLVVLVVLVVV